MDLVELLIHLEEEFDLKISDAEPTAMETPRDVIEFISGQESVANQFTRDQVAEKVWEIIVCELGIDRSKFTEDSSFTKDMYTGSFFRF